MKKTSIVPIVLFSLILMLNVNHMVRGLNFIPLLVLLLPAFGLVVSANKEIKGN